MLRARSFLLIIPLAILICTCFFAQPTGDKNHIVLLGGDWGWPLDYLQFQKMMENSSYAWSDLILWGFQSITLFRAFLFNGTGYITKILYENVQVTMVWWAFFCFFITYFGMKKLFTRITPAHEINCAGFITALLLFFFSPTIFDYAVMGWIYIVLSIAMLPIFVWLFIKGVDGDIFSLIFSAIVFSVAPQQQAIVWFFVCIMAILLQNLMVEKKIYKSIRVVMTLVPISLLLNAYWMLSMVLMPPSYLLSGDLVDSAISAGTMAHYPLHNAIRNWGSLFNYQFEKSQLNHHLSYFGYLMPLLAIIGLIRSRADYKWAFGLLMVSPMFFHFLGTHRAILSAIPLANAFRDVPRFSVLSLLGSSVLAGLGVLEIFSCARTHFGKRAEHALHALLCVMLLLTIYPWISGDLFNWRATAGEDIRLRFKSLSPSYYDLEEKLAKEKLLQKALYYPIGGTIYFKNDPRFRGAYREFQDHFAMYSPVPGALITSDKKMGSIDRLSSTITNDNPNKQQLEMLADTGIRIFIFRPVLGSAYPIPSLALIHEMLDSGAWEPWFIEDEVAAYIAKQYKPPIFINYQTNSQANEIKPTLEFKKLNPTLYMVRIHHAKDVMRLVFNEGYNPFWKMHVLPSKRQAELGTTRPLNYVSTQVDMSASPDDINDYLKRNILTLPLATSKSKAPLSFISSINQGSIQNDNLPDISILKLLRMDFLQTSHYQTNHYANGWTISPSQICQLYSCVHEDNGTFTLDLAIEFVSQRWIYIGTAVTLIAYIALFVCLAILFYRRKNTPGGI